MTRLRNRNTLNMGWNMVQISDQKQNPPSQPVRSVRSGAEDLWNTVTDPVERLLLTREAANVFEAEERYLDSAFPQVLALLQSPLSDEELGNHPLMVLFRSYGSPPHEDSLL
jgi:hypothetical protein